MTKMEVMIIADYSEKTFLDMPTVCELCGCSINLLLEMIKYDIIRPSMQTTSGNFLFDTQTVTKLKIVLRIQRDFDLNLSGLALVMDLIKERDMLLERNALLERHLFGSHF